MIAFVMDSVFSFSRKKQLRYKIPHSLVFCSTFSLTFVTAKEIRSFQKPVISNFETWLENGNEMVFKGMYNPRRL